VNKEQQSLFCVCINCIANGSMCYKAHFDGYRKFKLFIKYLFLFLWRNSLHLATVPSLSRLHDHARRTTVGRTPLVSPRHGPIPDNTQNTQETNIHAPDGIRTHNPSKRAAANPRLRSRGHWDRFTYHKDDKFKRDKTVVWSDDKLVRILVAKTELAM